MTEEFYIMNYHGQLCRLIKQITRKHGLDSNKNLKGWLTADSKHCSFLSSFIRAMGVTDIYPRQKMHVQSRKIVIVKPLIYSHLRHFFVHASLSLMGKGSRGTAKCFCDDLATKFTMFVNVSP